MYSNSRVYLCNAILVTVIFCYRYSTIRNFAQKWYFQTKFGDLFTNLLEINRTKFYLNLFRSDIFIVRCLGGYFFPDTVYRSNEWWHARWHTKSRLSPCASSDNVTLSLSLSCMQRIANQLLLYHCQPYTWASAIYTCSDEILSITFDISYILSVHFLTSRALR